MGNKFEAQVSKELNILKKAGKIAEYHKSIEMKHFQKQLFDHIVILPDDTLVLDYKAVFFEEKSAKAGKYSIDNLVNEKKQHQLDICDDFNKHNLDYFYIFRLNSGTETVYAWTKDIRGVIKEAKHKSYVSANDFSNKGGNLAEVLMEILKIDG